MITVQRDINIVHGIVASSRYVQLHMRNSPKLTSGSTTKPIPSLARFSTPIPRTDSQDVRVSNSKTVSNSKLCHDDRGSPPLRPGRPPAAGSGVAHADTLTGPKALAKVAISVGRNTTHDRMNAITRLFNI